MNRLRNCLALSLIVVASLNYAMAARAGQIIRYNVVWDSPADRAADFPLHLSRRTVVGKAQLDVYLDGIKLVHPVNACAGGSTD